MDRRLHHRPSRMSDSNPDQLSVLSRRAHRLSRRGEYRKAALALRERAMITGDAASWVALGDMLRRARRVPEALKALKQGLYLHRRQGAEGRARTVARMIVALDPWDTQANRHVA